MTLGGTTKILCCGVLCIACDQTAEVCPKGSELETKSRRCVVIDDDGSTALPPETIADGGLESDDGGERDGTLSPSSSSDGSVLTDVEAGEHDHEPDGKAGDAGQPACSVADVAAWEAFHVREGLVTAINDCVQPCDASACDPDQCLRLAAGVIECESCTRVEVDCAARVCSVACKRGFSDRECRACLCEAGCVDAYAECAGRPVDACREAFGRDAPSSEYTLPAQLLLNMKSQTGGLRVNAVQPGTPPSVLHEEHFAVDVGLLRAFGLAGRVYVLQHRPTCGTGYCFARISPLLADGSFGRPAYQAVWDAGWDELEVVWIGQRVLLARYKTGALATDKDPPGSLTLFEPLPDSEGNLTLVPRLATALTALGGIAYSNLESVSWEGRSYLLGLASDRVAEVRMHELTLTPQTIALAADGLRVVWSRGWDVVEAFEHGGRAYLLGYKSGRWVTTEEPMGTLVTVGIIRDASAMPGLSPSVLSLTWPTVLSHARAYHRDGRLWLATHSAAIGSTDIYALGDMPASWALGLSTSTYNLQWGVNPPWNLFDVAGGDIE